MNFYERAAKLVEETPKNGGRKVPKKGAKVTQGANVNPDGSNKTTMDRDDKEDFRDDDRPTHGINASKKKKNGDVDEWGSGQAVAQKNKRQADRKEKTGQSTVPHKYGRAQSLGPPGTFSDKDKEPYSDANKAKQQAQMDKDDAAAHAAQDAKKKKINASKKKKKKVTAEVKSGSGDLPGRDSTGAVVGGKPQMTNEPETPEQTKARKERAANAHKVNKANMQPLPDDKPINASKKKRVKVKEDMLDWEELIGEFFGSLYGSISEDQLDEMAAKASKKGKKKKKLNDEDDDQIERDQADREEDDAKAEDEEEAKTGQAVEANIKGPDTDPGKESDRAKKLSQTAQDSAERGNTATTDSGWRDKATGKQTTAPPGTQKVNASKKKIKAVKMLKKK